MGEGESYDFRTYTYMCILTANWKILHLTALAMGVIFTNLYLLVIFFARQPFSPVILSAGGTIFLVVYLCCLLAREEYVRLINRHLKNRPPHQGIILFILLFVVTLFSLGGDFVLPVEKLRTDSLVALGVAGLLFYPFYRGCNLMFELILRLVNKIRGTRVLDQEDFSRTLAGEFEAARRYDRPFSLICFGFTITRKAETRVRNNLVMTYFYNLVQANIRKTDVLGILQNGKVIGVISTNSTYDQAESQTRRLLAVLQKNPILAHKLKAFSSRFKAGICQFHQGLENHELLLIGAVNALTEALIFDEIDLKQGCVPSGIYKSG